MKRLYHSLIVRQDGRWSVQFGDYSESVVREEMREYRESGDWDGCRMQVLTTTDDQASIDANVAYMNQESKS